jgi:hypothetical protein
MTDMIKRTLNRPEQQLHSYSRPGDGRCAATTAISDPGCSKHIFDE